jgi:hypothetical protein
MKDIPIPRYLIISKKQGFMDPDSNESGSITLVRKQICLTKVKFTTNVLYLLIFCQTYLFNLDFKNY